MIFDLVRTVHFKYHFIDFGNHLTNHDRLNYAHGAFSGKAIWKKSFCKDREIVLAMDIHLVVLCGRAKHPCRRRMLDFSILHEVKVEVASRDLDGCNMRGSTDRLYRHALQIVIAKYIVNSLDRVLDTLFVLSLIIL